MKLILLIVAFFVLLLWLPVLKFIQFYNEVPKIEITLDATNPYDCLEEYPSTETFRGVPVYILDRLLQSESSWIYSAVNKEEDSRGLAQVNMVYFDYFSRKYGITDPMNPWQSLCFAADYLYDLYLATGSWYEACLAYKCGLDGRSNAPEFIKSICRMIVEGECR